jgi:hypothetical protein
MKTLLSREPEAKGFTKYAPPGFYGFKWNDPRQQCKQYEADFEEVSHGVLDYVIVHEFESDRFFSFHSSDSTYLTMDDVLEIFRTGPVPGIGEGI